MMGLDEYCFLVSFSPEVEEVGMVKDEEFGGREEDEMVGDFPLEVGVSLLRNKW